MSQVQGEGEMKVGDWVRIRDLENTTGVLLECGAFSDGWWSILNHHGRICVWPESQLELIDECG